MYHKKLRNRYEKNLKINAKEKSGKLGMNDDLFILFERYISVLVHSGQVRRFPKQ